MRIRSTKPEFWRSKTIAQLDWSTRLVLKGLESYVDDNGVGKDDIALIAADVFPRDLSANPTDTLARLAEAISRLAALGLIVRYVVSGENLLYIDRWKDIQRIDKPGKGRFPRPDGTLEYNQDVNRDSYASPRDGGGRLPEDCAPGTGEQGNRGTGEQGELLPRENRAAPTLATTTPAKAKAPSKERGHRLPDGWQPSDDLVRQMRAECPSLDLRAEHRRFVDYWIAQPGVKGRKVDWSATWRNWMRKQEDQAPPRRNGKPIRPGADAKAVDWQSLKDDDAAAQ